VIWTAFKNAVRSGREREVRYYTAGDPSVFQRG
jgi:hypothetical protein